MADKEIGTMTEEEIKKEIESLVARDEPLEGIEGLPQTNPEDNNTDEESDK